MGGLAGVTPVYAAAFGFFVFASAGLPLLSGFVGEFLVLVGAFVYSPIVAAVATFCMILAAAYLLWMFQRVAFGELSDFLRGIGHHLTDMTATEILTLAPLGALVVVFGVFPGLLLNLVAASVNNVLRDVGSARPIPIAPEVAIVAIALPIVFVVLRVMYAAFEDNRASEPLEAGGAAR
jgi:NADH-quinone oxidoreductase subunit M